MTITEISVSGADYARYLTSFGEEKVIRDITGILKETIKQLQARHELYLLLDDSNKKRIMYFMYDLYNVDNYIARELQDIAAREGQAARDIEKDRLHSAFKQQLEKAYNLVKNHHPSLRIDCGYWIQVDPPQSIEVRRRIYLNCRPEYIDTIVRVLLQYLLTNQARFVFKFPNFDDVRINGRLHQPHNDCLIRADKVVVYYGNDEPTHRVLEQFVQRYKNFLHPDQPLFTNRLVEGAGFAYEPTEDMHGYFGTHIKTKDPVTGREEPERASFGQFIALIATRYLIAWAMKHMLVCPICHRGAEITHKMCGGCGYVFARCSHCGVPLSGNAKICPGCGLLANLELIDRRYGVVLPNDVQIRQIALAVFHFKLKEKHKFIFTP